MNTINPKISVVTVTYNSEKTLQRTIDSIKCQKYPNIEYIVIDGGSTDSTVDIIEKNSMFISKWISEPDKGISDAFNKGIKLATGDVIGILNSDDIYVNDALNTISDVYDENIGLYLGNLIDMDASGNKYLFKPSVYHTNTGRGVVCHPSTFISKWVYDKLGNYDVSFRYAMDLDLLMRCERCNIPYLRIDKVLAVFSMEGITFDKFDRKKNRELIAVLKKNGATSFDILQYALIRGIKNCIIKILGRKPLMKKQQAE